MPASTFIVRSDIKDNIIEKFDLKDYLLETDLEIISLAQSLGVDEDDIENTPLHSVIKRYAVVYCLKRLCQDKAGTNNVEMPEMDKYLIKYTLYNKELDKIRPRISYEMFTGLISTIADRAGVSGTLYRG